MYFKVAEKATKSPFFHCAVQQGLLFHRFLVVLRKHWCTEKRAKAIRNPGAEKKNKWNEI